MIDTYTKNRIIKLLGKHTDSKIARSFGLNPCTVTRLRNKLNISKYDKLADLWENIDPIIFDVSARAIARKYNKYGVTRWVIDGRKKKLLKNKKPNKVVIIKVKKKKVKNKQKERSAFIRKEIEKHYGIN